MRNSFAFGTFAAALFALPLLIASPAHAGIEACGNIDVDASATCTAEVKDCSVTCSPVSVEAACAAQLDVQCQGMCPKVPHVDCSASCQGSCEADCNVKPAEFDCSASCKGDATAKCNSQCSSNGDQDKCNAICKAHFSADCDASCTGMPGSADCTAKCQGKCEGSCTAQTTLECELTCQGDLDVDCQAKVKGGCEADCADPNGAIFCDGQYIDHDGKVDACIQALKDKLDITVTASGTSSCGNSSCQAEGQASASCAFSPLTARGSNLAGGLALFAALGAVCMRRRKSR
jgi:hypothetical protein